MKEGGGISKEGAGTQRKKTYHIARRGPLEACVVAAGCAIACQGDVAVLAPAYGHRLLEVRPFELVLLAINLDSRRELLLAMKCGERLGEAEERGEKEKTEREREHEQTMEGSTLTSHFNRTFPFLDSSWPSLSVFWSNRSLKAEKRSEQTNGVEMKKGNKQMPPQK